MELILNHMDDGSLLIAELAADQPDPLKIRLGVTTAIVRYWGTTSGRGQLALSGPTEKTIIDQEPGGGEVNWLHVRRTIPVTQEGALRWMHRFAKK